MFSGDWEIDNLIMTDILDGIKFYSCSTRKKMLKQGKFKFSKYDQGSMLYGLTWRGYLKPNLYGQHHLSLPSFFNSPGLVANPHKSFPPNSSPFGYESAAKWS